MGKNVTIIDVAKECGLSKSTVAYALNPQEMDRISEKSRKKVNSAAKSLNYVPSTIARSLRANKTYSMGVMLPQPTNYFYGALSMELQRALWAKEYNVFFAFWDSSDDAFAIRQNYEKLLSWNVDGIITCELEGAFPSNIKKPFVFFQSTEIENHDTVNVDPSVLADGIKILMEKGHRKFALITSVEKSARNKVFSDALKRFDLEENPEWIFFEKDGARTLGQNAMKHLLSLKNKPTAIIGHNDAIAISAMNEAQRQGVNVPEEMAFMGFDNIEESAFSLPSLTTIGVPIKELAQSLTDTLLERIDHPERGIMHKTIKPGLIIRDSI